MENASKALIIAGAILLSILIIALGMNVYNSASSATGNADMSAQEINAHNSQFSAYEGKQKGTNIRTLLNLIAKNNEDYDDRQISILFTASSSSSNSSLDNVSDPAAIRSAITGLKTTSSYTVSFTYTGEGGVIDSCTIEPYKTNTQTQTP